MRNSLRNNLPEIPGILRIDRFLRNSHGSDDDSPSDGRRLEFVTQDNYLDSNSDIRNRRKDFLRKYLKNLLFLYCLNTIGYFYLHFVRLSHNDDSDIDFTDADLIFFLTLPFFCLFPINHLLSKNNKKHYITYLLGFFNGVNFSLLNNIGNLDKFSLDTYNFKRDDAFHILILALLILFLIYSISYVIYVSKRRKLVSYLILIPLCSLGIYCWVMINNGFIIHIHHYLIAIFLIFVSYHPRYTTIIINSVSFGVYLEGVVQWGYAPIVYESKN